MYCHVCVLFVLVALLYFNRDLTSPLKLPATFQSVLFCEVPTVLLLTIRYRGFRFQAVVTDHYNHSYLLNVFSFYSALRCKH